MFVSGRYRGYPIEELAEKSTFLEVAYLLVKGDLPNKVHTPLPHDPHRAMKLTHLFCRQQQYEEWTSRIMNHTYTATCIQLAPSAEPHFSSFSPPPSLRYIHQNLISLLQTFRYDAHPMGMVVRYALA